MNTQKFHAGDIVFFFDNKRTENGGIDRNAYVIRDAVITGVQVSIAYKIQKGNHVVFDRGDYTSRVEYRLCNRCGLIPEDALFETLDEALYRAAQVKAERPEILTIDEAIMGFVTEQK